MVVSVGIVVATAGGAEFTHTGVFRGVGAVQCGIGVSHQGHQVNVGIDALGSATCCAVLQVQHVLNPTTVVAQGTKVQRGVHQLGLVHHVVAESFVLRARQKDKEADGKEAEDDAGVGAGGAMGFSSGTHVWGRSGVVRTGSRVPRNALKQALDRVWWAVRGWCAFRAGGRNGGYKEIAKFSRFRMRRSRKFAKNE